MMLDLGAHDHWKVVPFNRMPLCESDDYPIREAEEIAEILRQSLENAGAGVWELDLVAELVRLSPQSRRMYGLPDNHSGVLTQQEWLETINSEDRRRFQDELALATPAAPLRPQELRITRPDGEVRWLRISGGHFPDRAGGPARLHGLLFDETDRWLAVKAMRESEERLRLIQESVRIGTFLMDADGATIGSRQFYRNLGIAEDAGMLGVEALEDFVHPDDIERVEREMSGAVQAARGFDSEYRIIQADTGEMRWIFSRTSFEQTNDGQQGRMAGVHLDITESKLAKVALDESVALNHSILEASADCVKLIDLEGRLLFVNKPGLAALEVKDASVLLGKSWVELWPRKERRKAEAALHKARAGQTGRFNGGCPTALGRSKWWDVVVTPICDERGQPRQCLVISRDVTDHRNQMAQIRWTASHDMLTELPNRRYFQKQLGKALAEAATRHGSVGLLHIDIDDFKQINDALGHDAGDSLLKEFTLRLQGVTRNIETVARLGGDEFAIIIPELTADRSLSGIVADIQARLAEPFLYQGRVFDCRASIGKAIYPDHGETGDELLKNADIALYVAKAAGRGSVRCFHPAMRAEIQARVDMIDQARRALRDDKIIPYYQPKIDLETGAPAGFEALLRWEDPDGQIQLPAAIDAAFEDLDVAQAISERMQLRVLADMRRWIDAGVDFGHVAINASAAEFRQNVFAESLLARIQAARIPTSFIELEVTETVFLGRGAEYVERALKLLSAKGVRIALDDFGTGYASLSHLKRFPVNIIKIDQSFVRDLDVDPDDAAIIRALISLGKSLSIGIVAEGIETHAQYAFLAEQGCNYGQGFLFSKAVAAANVPELVWETRMKGFRARDYSPCKVAQPYA